MFSNIQIVDNHSKSASRPFYTQENRKYNFYLKLCQNPLRENDNGIKFGIAKIKTIPDILEFIMPKCSHYHTILFHLTTAKLKRK